MLVIPIKQLKKKWLELVDIKRVVKKRYRIRMENIEEQQDKVRRDILDRGVSVDDIQGEGE